MFPQLRGPILFSIMLACYPSTPFIIRVEMTRCPRFFVLRPYKAGTIEIVVIILTGRSDFIPQELSKQSKREIQGLYVCPSAIVLGRGKKEQIDPELKLRE